MDLGIALDISIFSGFIQNEQYNDTLFEDEEMDFNDYLVTSSEGYQLSHIVEKQIEKFKTDFTKGVSFYDKNKELRSREGGSPLQTVSGREIPEQDIRE